MKTSFFTICEVPLKGFQIALSIFSFLHILKWMLLGEKKKVTLSLCRFSVIVVSLKTNNFYFVSTSLRCVFPFLLPLPLSLVDWLADQFLCS